MRAFSRFPVISIFGLVVALQCAAAQPTVPSTIAKPHPGTLASQAPAAPPAPAPSPAPVSHASAPKAHPAPAPHPSSLSGSYTISQLGHAVGTAGFVFVRSDEGIDSTSTVNVSMQGLDYAISKTERLDPSRQIVHEQLSAAVNGSAVSITGKPDAAQFLLNISANGRSSTSRLAAHNGAVFLPDFDPGALQTLLKLAAAQNNRDLWVIVPKQSGSVEPVQLATYPDEHGTLDGKELVVHHLVATIGGAETDLFAGPEDQLLQAELPEQGFSVVRKGFVLAPPRRPVMAPAQ